ncbi:membrane fusion protein (multidrug efflux system) [Herbaspirillum sp. Sphag1AN]|uniref:efflux RND transporter periplasmic adaptor subunit n=1 Tax=unclassified Herbaspirillum TaxID=2624150 RepID=UPI00161CF877|nr:MULTISPECIES: efflux RND transporter periplasmic adaptor subunit [unclassified Herbaspirillum]MBB3213869.1 membrane fusion protein (multidrug efflux system) [Herbaspirillum sp. Sphag1AN]MBB3247066.1 membrane fusion protein (multidrug efflux system) [Herbaspirillum sp. Sphag64]
MSSPKKIIIAMATAAAVASLLGACSKPAGMGPPPAQGTPVVSVLTLQEQSVALTSELPARVNAVLSADVRPQITGLVRSRNFVEGSDVKAGSLLYEIDPATYRATYNNAKATLDKAVASLHTARLKAERYQELVKIQAVSVQDNDDIQATLQQDVADVEAAQASLDSAKINLDFTRITAPISGRIGKSSVTPGALVTADQTTALANVQQLDPIYVDLTQSSNVLLRLQRELEEGKLSSKSHGGATVSLVFDDGSRYPVIGILQFSDVTVDQNTGTVNLRAKFDNPKHQLLPGMFVRAVVEEGTKEHALLVPQPAVSRDGAGKPVAYVVNANNKVEQRHLVTDRAIGDQWLVSSGLQAGDRVVVEGLQKIRPGVEVKTLPYTSVSSTGTGSLASTDASAGDSAKKVP